MAQSSASTQALRNREDKSGFGENRQVQARTGQIARRGAKGAGNAGKSQKSVEAHYAGKDRPQASWEVRAPDLGMPNWERRSGPATGWEMARYMAALIDHDESRIIAFGGRKFAIELRPLGSANVEKYELSGWPVWRYAANRVTA